MKVLLPIDLLQMREFRKLRDLIPSREACGPSTAEALLYIFALYQELTYASTAGQPPRMIDDQGMRSLIETLGNAEHAPELLVTSGWLVADGAGKWICPKYESAGAGMNETARLGGHARAYSKKIAKSGEKAVEVASLLSEDKFVDAAGKPLDGTTSKRVIMLIVAVDSALGVSDRQIYAYSPAMIQDALAALNQFTNEQLESACQRIMRKRVEDHPVLRGVGTEKLLGDLGGFVERLK